MSAPLNRKEAITPYLISGDWEKVLFGDVELFEEMTNMHIPALLADAEKEIKRAKQSGILPTDALYPKELVGETLIMAWQMRRGRPKRAALKNWLLEVQKYALQKVIDEERKYYEPIAVSLEAHVPAKPESKDENEFWDWVEPSLPEQWVDVIPDAVGHPLAA
jgi:hypothetical protein